jgi:ankyrin repeat protein
LWNSYSRFPPRFPEYATQCVGAMTNDLLRIIEGGDSVSLRRALDASVLSGRELNTALQAAVRRGLPELIRVLVEHGADVRCRDEQTTWSLVHTAVEHRQLAAIQELVQSGVDVNTEDGQGWTPLHLAVDVEADAAEQKAVAPDTRSIRLLLELGADPKHVNKEGETAIDKAEAWNQPDLVAVLRRA